MGLGGLTEMCGFPHHHPEVAPKSSLDHSPSCSQSPLGSPKAGWVTCLMKPWPHPSLTGVSYFSPGPLSRPHHTSEQGSGFRLQLQVEQESCALPPSSPRISEEDKRTSGHCKVCHRHRALEDKGQARWKVFHVKSCHPLTRPAYTCILYGFTFASIASVELIERRRRGDFKAEEGPFTSTGRRW